MSATGTWNLCAAAATDAPAIDAFLAAHAATSMFLRSNLASNGTEDTVSPHGTTFYLGVQDHAIRAVFGITNKGYLLAQAPDVPHALWAEFAARITGRTVCGMTGVPEQVETCLAAVGLSEGPWQIHADEPLYHLEIARLKCDPVAVRKAVAADLPMLEAWFNAYEQDVGHAPVGSPPSARVLERAARAIDSADVMLLEHDGTPVAMAGINARLPDIVQIGGVYTPKALRGRGYARRALAGLLRACADQRVTQSVLFANNAAAARAYEALGYRLIGQYRVCLLLSERVIGGTS